MHPTVKPVALVAEAIKDCSRRGEVVLDPFGGAISVSRRSPALLPTDLRLAPAVPDRRSEGLGDHRTAAGAIRGLVFANLGAFL
jgi:hypothetical protein